MPYSVLMITHNHQTSECINTLIDWSSVEVELVATEFHASLGLQRFIHTKPDIVLLEPKAVIMNIDKYVELMAEHWSDFIAVLCCLQDENVYETYNHHIVGKVELSQTTQAEFTQYLIEKLNVDMSNKKISTKQVVTNFFDATHTHEETSEFLHKQFLSQDWQELWFCHCRVNEPSSCMDEAGKALHIAFNTQEIMILHHSPTDIILALDAKTFPTVPLLRKKVIELINYNIGNMNKLYYSYVKIRNKRDLTNAFFELQELIQYSYFEPSFLGITRDEISRYQEAKQIPQIQKAIINIGIAVTQKKKEALKEYIDVLYYALLQDSLDFSLIHYARNQLDLVYDFIQYLINPMRSGKRLALPCDTLSDEVEYLTHKLTHIIYLLPDKLTYCKSPLIDAIFYIYLNHNKPSLSLYLVADEINRSASYLSTLFSVEMGEGFVLFLQKVRIRHACRLLASGYKIKSVAASVGILDQRYFSHVFKKITGLTPSAYQQSIASQTRG